MLGREAEIEAPFWRGTSPPRAFWHVKQEQALKIPEGLKDSCCLLAKFAAAKPWPRATCALQKIKLGCMGDTSWQCIPYTNSHQRISEGQQTIQKSLQIYIFLHVVPCLPEKVQRSQKKNAGNLNTTKTRGEGMTETITKCIVLIGSWNEASISPNYTEGLQRQPKLAHCEQMEFSDGFFSYAISN